MCDIFMRFPGGKAKALTLSYDDGVLQDQRLIKIMIENSLKGTFNLNSGLFGQENSVTRKRMTKEEALAVYQNSGMEIALHSVTHPHLDWLSEEVCTQEIVGDRDNLERLFGKSVRGMAYPYGTTNDTVIGVLQDAGMAYARTTETTEKFDIPTDWLRLPTTCHHTNPRLMKLATEFIESEVRENPLIFYVWGHSFEFDNNSPTNNWGVIEEFAGYVGNRADIWYATNIEIYDYITAYGQLEFRENSSLIFNPSSVSIYLAYNNQIYVINSGAVLEIGK